MTFMRSRFASLKAVMLECLPLISRAIQTFIR